MSLDPYKTLGVKKKASLAEIKAAHRRAAKRTHTDKGGNHEEFLAVQRSYEILSDDEARKRFDECGDTKEAVPLRERCLTELARLAIMCVDQCADPKGSDLVSTMKQVNQGAVEQAKKERDRAQRKAEKFSEAAKRFVPNAKGVENPFEVMLSKEAQNCQLMVRAAEDRIQMAEECLKILDEFKYRRDKPDYGTAMFFGATIKSKPPLVFGGSDW